MVQLWTTAVFNKKNQLYDFLVNTSVIFKFSNMKWRKEEFGMPSRISREMIRRKHWVMH